MEGIVSHCKEFLAVPFLPAWCTVCCVHRSCSAKVAEDPEEPRRAVCTKVGGIPLTGGSSSREGSWKCGCSQSSALSAKLQALQQKGGHLSREDTDVWELGRVASARGSAEVSRHWSCGEVVGGEQPGWPEVASLSTVTQVYWQDWDTLRLEDGILDGQVLFWQIIAPK